MVVDANRLNDRLSNYNPGKDLSVLLADAGVAHDRVVAVGEDGFLTQRQEDGSLAYMTENLAFVAWEPLAPFRRASGDQSGMAELSRLHAHLRALHLALSSGLPWVLVLESSVDFSRASMPDCGSSVSELVAKVPADSWRVLQVRRSQGVMNRVP